MARTRDADVTVRLRACAPEDASWLEGWLPRVAGTAGYDAPTLIDAVAGDRAACARIVVHEDAPCGVVVSRAPVDGRGVIELVAVTPSASRRGAGMQAAALVENELKADGARSIIAPASERHGISVYFWIRLGYRPLRRNAWPAESSGIAWFVRDIA